MNISTPLLHIVIVEDNVAHVEAIRRAFEDDGIPVDIHTTATLREYRAYIAENSPDIALIDLNLPDGCAVEILSYPPEDAPFPILIMTAFGSQSVVVKVMKAGALDYIVKSPEVFTAIPHSVERILREWKLLMKHHSQEAELIARDRRYSKLVANIGDVIVIIDQDGINRYKSPNIEKLFGWRPEEVVGTGALDNVHPDDLVHARNFIGTLLCEPNATGSTECRYRCKDGQYKWIEFIGVNLIHDPDIQGLLGNYHDITERKQAEVKKASLEEQIRQQQRLESIGQLAAGVAHDFNNLLTGINVFTKFAYDAVPDGSVSRDDLAEVLTLVNRSADLVRQLLAFSRRQTMHMEVVDVNELVANSTKMLGRLIGESIDFKFIPKTDVGTIKADPGQIEQVLVNIIINARDAMPNGGMLTIETSTINIDEEYSRSHTGIIPGFYVMIDITDTGCGIEETVLEHIFEPFFTTKEFGKGTGLGLATAYGIIKQHGGNIWAYSEKDKGTIFKICLPLVEDEIIVIPVTKQVELLTGTETILIVEDEALVRGIAKRILEKYGYKVLTAELPSEAITIFDEFGNDIVLMLTDVVMPECSGPELYETIHEKYPKLKVLFMSGYPDNVSYPVNMLDPNAYFIAKPFNLDSLGKKVREVLNEREK